MGDVYTNADRLRAMTDEELVELFTNNTIYDGRYFVVCPSNPEGDCITADCRECFLRWLKQEYKGEK